MALKSLRKIKSAIICPPKVGELVEGKILSRGRSSLFLDLGAKGIGVIYGKEFFDAKDSLKGLEPDDVVFAKVLKLETEDGYRELSLVKAAQELAWGELMQAKEKEEIFDVQIKGANKGGLIAEVKGIQAFLPASQLLPEHYPKLERAEPAKIASELQKFLGKKTKVKILDVNAEEKKLILSEKATKKEKVVEELINYTVGDTVEGEISGVTNFGAFFKFGKGLEGLIHSSEIKAKENKNPVEALRVGDKFKAKIIEIANNRVYLSLKAA